MDIFRGFIVAIILNNFFACRNFHLPIALQRDNTNEQFPAPNQYSVSAFLFSIPCRRNHDQTKAINVQAKIQTMA